MPKYSYFKVDFLSKFIKRPIERIYLHTVAVRGESSLEGIDRYHREVKGWDGFAYHEYIKKSGLALAGRDPDAPGAGVLGDNAYTYHIVMEGHGDYEPWTDAQWETLINRLISIMYRCKTKEGLLFVDVFRKNPMHLLGHREVNWLIKAIGLSQKFGTLKSCPGNLVDMIEVRKRVWAAVNKVNKVG